MSSDYEPQDKKPRLDFVDLDTKIKIVNLAKEHPNWKLKTIKANGGSALSRMDELTRWKKEIKNDKKLDLRQIC